MAEIGQDSGRTEYQEAGCSKTMDAATRNERRPTVADDMPEPVAGVTEATRTKANYL